MGTQFLTQYHKIVSGVIAVTFVVIVQAFSVPFPVFRYLIPAVMVGFFCVQLYNYFYLEELGKGKAWALIRLSIFFVAWFGLLALLPSTGLRGVYLVLSVPVIYIFERALGNFGEYIILNEVLVIAWAVFLVTFGLTSYLQTVSPFLAVAQFVCVALLVRSSLSFVPYGESIKWVGALAVTLFTTELAWALSFLPFHFSALATLCFALFYVCYALYFYALFNTLTWKRVQFHIGLAAALSLLIIIITPWKVLV